MPKPSQRPRITPAVAIDRYVTFILFHNRLGCSGSVRTFKVRRIHLNWNGTLPLKQVTLKLQHHTIVEPTRLSDGLCLNADDNRRRKPNMPNTADKLPYDTLCIIFEYCAESDSPSEPLEVLLLVCKSWANAARSHAGLWSTFDIALEASSDPAYWASCVRRRMARCRPDTLIDVELSSTYETRISKSPVFLEGCEKLLLALNGEAGDIARRWRRFLLSSGFTFLSQDIIARSFSFPTPNLEEFRLDYHLRGNHTILPDTSSLKSFHVSGLAIRSLPDLSNVTDIYLDVDNLDERSLATAVGVVNMKLRNWKPFKLNATYPRMETLELEGKICQDCLVSFSAPNLRDLTLAVDRGCDYLHVVQCKGIDLKNLKRANIGWPYRIEDDTVADYLTGVRQFLTAAVNLEILVLERNSIEILVLKLLTSDCEWLYQTHVLRIEVDEEEMELGRGEDRLISVNQLREKINCIPDSDWDTIFKHLNPALQF